MRKEQQKVGTPKCGYLP